MEVLVCYACGTKTPLKAILTASPACQVCGNYGTTIVVEAVVVDARVEAAEVYPWTPYIAPDRLRRELYRQVMAEYARQEYATA